MKKKKQATLASPAFFPQTPSLEPSDHVVTGQAATWKGRADDLAKPSRGPRQYPAPLTDTSRQH